MCQSPGLDNKHGIKVDEYVVHLGRSSPRPPRSTQSSDLGVGESWKTLGSGECPQEPVLATFLPPMLD